MVSRALGIRLEFHHLLDVMLSKLFNYLELKYHHVREALLDYPLSKWQFCLVILYYYYPFVFFIVLSHFVTEFLFVFYYVSSPMDCKFHKYRVWLVHHWILISQHGDCQRVNSRNCRINELSFLISKTGINNTTHIRDVIWDNECKNV